MTAHGAGNAGQHAAVPVPPGIIVQAAGSLLQKKPYGAVLGHFASSPRSRLQLVAVSERI